MFIVSKRMPKIIDRHEDLLHSLKTKKDNINNSLLYDYLNSLLELEFSAFSKQINETDKQELMEKCFGLYKKISIYNIINRVSNIFSEDSDRLCIDKDEKKSLNVFIKGKRVISQDYFENPNYSLFSFKSNLSYPKIFFKPKLIGSIDINQYFQREGQNSVKIEELKELIETLKDKINSTNIGTHADEFEISQTNIPPKDGIDTDEISYQRYGLMEKIRENEKRIEYYQNKKDLTNDEKMAIELAEKYYGLLQQEFNINPDEFVPQETNKDNQILVLSKPNYSIKKTIHYVE